MAIIWSFHLLLLLTHLFSLALCELHLSLTALVLRVIPQMELFETSVRDVAYDHDMFIPRPVAESKGVRVTIK